MNKDLHNEKTARIFHSLDGLEPQQAPDFFYTRLRARMQREQEESVPTGFFLRPAFLAISLSLVLIFNIAFLVQKNVSEKPGEKRMDNNNGIQAFSEAYNLNNSSLYE